MQRRQASLNRLGTCRNLTQRPRQQAQESGEKSPERGWTVGCYLGKLEAPRKSAFKVRMDVAEDGLHEWTPQRAAVRPRSIGRTRLRLQCKSCAGWEVQAGQAGEGMAGFGLAAPSRARNIPSGPGHARDAPLSLQRIKGLQARASRADFFLAACSRGVGIAARANRAGDFLNGAGRARTLVTMNGRTVCWRKLLEPKPLRGEPCPALVYKLSAPVHYPVHRL
jgi:hypothetical protein